MGATWIFPNGMPARHSGEEQPCFVIQSGVRWQKQSPLKAHHSVLQPSSQLHKGALSGLFLAFGSYAFRKHYDEA